MLENLHPFPNRILANISFMFNLGHMLLHKLYYINVTIANILLYRLTSSLESSGAKIQNLKSDFVENRFLANILFCIHFRSYVAS